MGKRRKEVRTMTGGESKMRKGSRWYKGRKEGRKEGEGRREKECEKEYRKEGERR